MFCIAQVFSRASAARKAAEVAPRRLRYANYLRMAHIVVDIGRTFSDHESARIACEICNEAGSAVFILVNPKNL
jgi:hypothetical protein